MRQAQVQPVRTGVPSTETIWAALSVAVLFHYRIGWRMLPYKFLVCTGGTLLLLCYGVGAYAPEWAQWLFAPDNPAMLIFVAAFVGRTLYLRHQHWQLLTAKRRSYPTTSAGRSYLPEWKNGVTYRLVEPAICIVVGYFVKRYVSFPLGIWLMWAGFCLGWWERSLWQRMVHDRLDVHDAVVEGQYYASHADNINAPQQDTPRDEGVGTGLGDMGRSGYRDTADTPEVEIIPPERTGGKPRW